MAPDCGGAPRLEVWLACVCQCLEVAEPHFWFWGPRVCIAVTISVVGLVSQLFAPQLGGTHFLPCLLRVDSRAQQRPGAMPCLGLGTRGKEKETQAHFAEDVLSRQTGSCSFW